MRARICPRPVEKAAIDVSALVSELQLITLTCRTRDTSIHPAFAPGARDEREESQHLLQACLWQSWSSGAWQIHYRANLQSQRVVKSGDRFCSTNVTMLHRVMPLSTVPELVAPN
jgi:hypothetical protein